MTYKPQYHNSVSPYLLVKEPAKLIAFLKAVFDGELILEHNRPDGTLMHAEVRIDDSVVMLGQTSEDWEPQPSMVHIYVPDAEKTYQRALQAGGTSQQEPKVSDSDPKDNDLRGGFVGPCGNSWWVATHRAPVN